MKKLIVSPDLAHWTTPDAETVVCHDLPPNTWHLVDLAQQPRPNRHQRRAQAARDRMARR